MSEEYNIPDVNTTDIDKYISLYAMKKDLQAQVDAVNEEMDAVSSRIMQQFLDSGTSGIKREDGTNVSLRRQIYASRDKRTSPDEFNEALKKHDLGELVNETVNASKLSALVREYENEGQILPEEIQKMVSVHERFSLSVRGFKV